MPSPAVITFLKRHLAFRWIRPQCWEWDCLRLMFAWFLFFATKPNFAYTNLPAPNGIAHWIDLRGLSDPALYDYVLWPIWIASLVVYATGRFTGTAATGLFVIYTLSETMKNSQGGINHSHQIIEYVLIGQIIAAVIAFWRERGQRARGRTPARCERAADYVVLSQQMIVATYVISAISKFLASGWDWIKDSPNIVLHIEKNTLYKYHDFLSKRPGGDNDAIVAWIVENPNAARVMLGSGLFLELLAFLALFNRWIMIAWGIGLITFHQLVSGIMGLNFYNNKALVFIFLLNIPWLIGGLVQKIAPSPARLGNR